MIERFVSHTELIVLCGVVGPTQMCGSVAIGYNLAANYCSYTKFRNCGTEDGCADLNDYVKGQWLFYWRRRNAVRKWARTLPLGAFTWPPTAPRPCTSRTLQSRGDGPPAPAEKKAPLSVASRMLAMIERSTPMSLVTFSRSTSTRSRHVACCSYPKLSYAREAQIRPI